MIIRHNCLMMLTCSANWWSHFLKCVEVYECLLKKINGMDCVYTSLRLRFGLFSTWTPGTLWCVCGSGREPTSVLVESPGPAFITHPSRSYKNHSLLLPPSFLEISVSSEARRFRPPSIYLLVHQSAAPSTFLKFLSPTELLSSWFLSVRELFCEALLFLQKFPLTDGLH